MLVATGRLVQTSSGHVTHSATSKMFTSESPAGALFLVMLEHGLRGYLHWPEYFARYGVKEATGPTNNPYTVSWGHPETNMWEIIAADEEKQRVFAAGMRTTDSIAGKYGGPASIYSFAWLGDLASAEVKHDKQRALVVDVGGSHGATLKHILEANPSLPAERCVLQDRAEVIEEAIQRDDPALRAVRRMPHDFNHEQPVKGKPPSLPFPHCNKTNTPQAPWSTSSAASSTTTATTSASACSRAWPRPCRATTAARASSSWTRSSRTRRRPGMRPRTWLCSTSVERSGRPPPLTTLCARRGCALSRFIGGRGPRWGLWSVRFCRGHRGEGGLFVRVGFSLLIVGWVMGCFLVLWSQ